jgi:hypothetical protein
MIAKIVIAAWSLQKFGDGTIAARKALSCIYRTNQTI